MFGVSSIRSTHTTCHSLAVEVDDTSRVVIVDFRPVHVNQSIGETAVFELIINGYLLRLLVELNLTAHQRVGVDARYICRRDVVRATSIRCKCRRVLKENCLIMSRCLNKTTGIRSRLNMSNQRQLLVAYLCLCRLVVHVLFDVPCE